MKAHGDGFRALTHLERPLNSTSRPHWLVGANGVYRGYPMGEWQRIGSFDFHTNSIMTHNEFVIAGVNCGVWEISPGTGVWRQLHDETVTEVLTVVANEQGGRAKASAYADILIGCPYGIAASTSTELGARRWTFYSDDLRVNERFTNAILPILAGDTYLVGTESGVLVFDWKSKRFTRTSLTGSPVRALLEVEGRFYAGTDGSGAWMSLDGDTWHPAGIGIDDRDILSLAFDGENFVAGTDRGFLLGLPSKHWKELGPSVLVSAIAIDPEGSGRWLAGCQPTGLWWTEDGGATFSQTGTFNTVRAVLGPAQHVTVPAATAAASTPEASGIDGSIQPREEAK